MPQIATLATLVVTLLQIAISASASSAYWRDPRIHGLGNTGTLGFVHACVAPLATRIIDAHFGEDVRARVHATLCDSQKTIDLGCGTGMSTPPSALGVDASMQMLAVAEVLRPGCTFAHGNIESFGEDCSWDVSLLSFVLHEVPPDACVRILANAARITRSLVLVVDIEPDGFEPPPSMIHGEPYLYEYLANIDTLVALVRGTVSRSFTLVPGKVRLWALEVVR